MIWKLVYNEFGIRFRLCIFWGLSPLQYSLIIALNIKGSQFDIQLPSLILLLYRNPENTYNCVYFENWKIPAMLLSYKEWFMFIKEIKIFVSSPSENIKSDLNFSFLFKIFTIVQTEIQ